MANGLPEDNELFEDTQTSGRLEEEHARLGAFMLALRSRGIHDTRVLGAIETIPRALFLSASAKAHALDDRSLPIDCGQTISAPSILAVMLQAASIAPDHRVLDIGTGSGYAAAVAAKLGGEIYTVDRYKTLVDLARDRFAALRLFNIIAECRDGLDGWPEHAPFDRIIVSAAAPDIPAVLLRSLRPGGIMILPVGQPGGQQSLLKLTAARTAGLLPLIDHLADVRFVPLTPGRAGNL
jgi:protein-L-isoaspartate(D-aspartate) O-methyltransferase